MRAAAILAATIVALGAYLALAAGLAISPTWIGIGMLGIAVAGAIAITMATSPSITVGGIARS